MISPFESARGVGSRAVAAADAATGSRGRGRRRGRRRPHVDESSGGRGEVRGQSETAAPAVAARLVVDGKKDL